MNVERKVEHLFPDLGIESNGIPYYYLAGEKKSSIGAMNQEQ